MIHRIITNNNNNMPCELILKKSKYFDQFWRQRLELLDFWPRRNDKQLFLYVVFDINSMKFIIKLE